MSYGRIAGYECRVRLPLEETVISSEEAATISGVEEKAAVSRRMRKA